MLSIIIPTYNEERGIGETLRTIYKQVDDKENIEVIIADGGSTDNTTKVAAEYAVRTIACDGRGRALQMNTGARTASGDILYFLHADTFPPKHFDQLIISAFQNGFRAGCFTMEFDYHHRFLQLNAWFTRFNINAFRFGDQSLFISRDCFVQSGGFNENFIIFEDQEIIKRIRQCARFTVLQEKVITSARKYIRHGIYKTQFIYFLTYLFYILGADQHRLLEWYERRMPNNEL